jgi:predicted nucleic acid-binding protein
MGPPVAVLLDTDVLIDHLRGARELRPPSGVASYSVVTRCELYSGRAADEREIDRLLSAFRELPVDRSVAERAGRLRRETGVRTPDVLIAATALVHGVALMTRNVRDFERVPGLRLAAPTGS